MNFSGISLFAAPRVFASLEKSSRGVFKTETSLQQRKYIIQFIIFLPRAQGVKANVLFFDNRTGSPDPQTRELWIYDLRTNNHLTLKNNPLTYENLKDFIECYNPKNRNERKETERFKPYSYEELIPRDKANLDTTWIKDESLEELENLPKPEVLAAEIIENLKDALSGARTSRRLWKRLNIRCFDLNLRAHFYTVE